MKLEEGRARIITHKELAGTRARSFYFTHRTSYLNFDKQEKENFMTMQKRVQTKPYEAGDRMRVK